MTRWVPALAAALVLAAVPAAGQRPQFMLVVHGGAGTILRQDMTPAEDSAYRAELTRAIRVGYDVLRSGGRSVDAVGAVITVLEDSPLFNAGKGAVLTSAGTFELDAAIMDGAALRAGAVAGVKHIRNPIALARLVMDSSPHVLLAGEGAEAFATEHGMALVPQSYFYTERRAGELERLKVKGAKPRTHGTAGAIALDRQGRLAAGTSTGGTANKRPGRIGDTPIIGAGTYADDACAVSATGVGEYFIRNVVAHDICARVRYKGASLEQAAREVVMEELVSQHGDGGVIAMDKQGEITAQFNTEGMLRGWVGPDGRIVVKIYKDE